VRQSDGLWGDTPEDCEMRRSGAKASIEMARLLGVSDDNAALKDSWLEENRELRKETEDLRKQVKTLASSLKKYEYLVEKKENRLTPEQAERITQIAAGHNTTLTEVRFGSHTYQVCDAMRAICKYLADEGRNHLEIAYFLRRERSTIRYAIQRANGKPPRGKSHD